MPRTAKVRQSKWLYCSKMRSVAARSSATPLIGVTAESPPIVEHKRVRIAADCTVDVSSTARADEGVCQSRWRGS